MSFVEWDDGMLLGVDVIDAEHKKLIEHLNKLYNAFEHNESFVVLGETLEAICAFAVEHFKHEEALFGSTAYAHLHGEAHRAEHAEMLGHMRAFQDKFRFGPSDALSVELMLYLKDFIRGHVCGTDLAYVPYLKGKTERA